MAEAGGEVTCTEDVQAAVDPTDMVYTDVWVSMGMEARRRTTASRRLPDQRRGDALGKPDALVMHCLATRQEIDEETFEAHADTIFTQAENRLHAQKAIMSKLAV